MARRFQVLQDRFDAGIQRDGTRVDGIPGSLYSCTDFLPNLGGVPLRNRGGWTDLLGFSFGGGSGTAIHRMISVPSMPADYQLQVVSSDAKIHFVNEAGLYITTAGTVLAGVPAGNLALFNSGGTEYVVYPSPDGTLAAYKGTGATITVVSGGTYPTAKHFVTYKQRLLAANTAANPNRLWVSNASDITTWDTTYHWYDTPKQILGVAALRNSALIFHPDSTTRLRGTSPGGPSVSGDIELDNNFFQVGLAGNNGALSITYWQENVIWADANGIYMSDGAAIVDLVERGGIRSLWNHTFTAASGRQVACGVHRDWLVVTVFNTLTNTEVSTLICYLPNRAWYQASNFPFRCYASQSRQFGNRLYAGRGEAMRIGLIDGVFGSSGATDGNTVAITPSLETNFFRNRPGNSQLAKLWVGYALRDVSTGPTLAVNASVLTGSNTINTSLGSLAKTSSSATAGEGYVRKGVSVNRRGEGMALSLTLATTTATEVDIYSLEAEYTSLSGYR